MGSKELSVKQGIAVSKVDQWINSALSNNGGSDNTNSSDSQNENTIDDMLRHPQVKKHGTFGRLSSSQQNLVTSVVSVMQDKVSSDAKKNAESLKEIILAEREALKAMSHSFASTAKSLYKLPLISSLKNTDDVKDVTEKPASSFSYDEEVVDHDSPDVPSESQWGRFFSWGNMISIAALVLLILVVKTSVETANFETQYRNAASDVETLKLTLEAKDKKYDGLLNELQLAQVKIASLESDINGKTKNAEQMQSNLELTIQKQEEQLKKIQLLSVTTQASLNAEIKALQTEVALFKGKEIDGAQQNEIWKQLAKERKEELSKLQAQILALSELSRSKDVAESEDNSGWSLF